MSAVIRSPRGRNSLRKTPCSFGTGAPRDLAALGITADHPLAAIRESIAIARALFSGEVVQCREGLFRAEGRRLSSGAHRIPVMVAASGAIPASSRRRRRWLWVALAALGLLIAARLLWP